MMTQAVHAGPGRAHAGRSVCPSPGSVMTPLTWVQTFLLPSPFDFTGQENEFNKYLFSE